MKRKLVKQGAATMMVSLPAKWIKQNNLKKGSEIDIEEKETDLLISAKPIEIKKQTEIKLANLTETSVRTLINNTYRSGYDRIKVSFQTENQFKILGEVIKTRLIGFEIIKREKDSCIVENVTEPSSEKFDTILQKMFFSISELFAITKDRLENPKEEYSYKQAEERIQRYDNFCRRIIIKQKLTNIKAAFLWGFLAQISYGQRQLYHLNNVLKKGLIISDKTKQLLEDIKKMFEIIKNVYISKNVDDLGEVHKLNKELIKKTYSLLQQKQGKENIILHHIMMSIRSFYQSNSPLSGFII
ncbi:MAG: hypothetical protein JXA60_10840 [Candidatus Coatesbacteria bacterium]|nr:hypothetical protein [Candidatus Coatesbacteria bacterium]